MAGGLPTGSNSGYITPHPFSVIGAGFAALNDRNEANVRSTLEDQVKSTPDLVNLSGQVFAGINAELGVVGGIIEAFFHRILGAIPFIDHGAVESAAEQILDQIDTFFGNWRHFLGDLNFLDPSFDPANAVADFVGGMIYPLNMLATLVSGVIPGIQIPLLDATKIATGILDIGRIPAGIVNAAGDIVRSLVKGATGTIDELAQWGQGILSGDWMQQLSIALLGKPGGLDDIQNWANSLRTNVERIPLSLIDGLNDIGQLIHVGLIGKPTTSPNLLDNADLSLPVDPVDGFYWEGPQLFLFTVGGTVPSVSHQPAAVQPVGRAVDEDIWSAYAIDYGAFLWPMRNSINGGKTKLIAAINALKPGTKFAFTGESQGAVVCSEVYEDELLNVAGSLHSRLPDFVGATMFGNPRRHAGSHALGTPDPGTNGIAGSDLMVAPPSFWYDYTNPGDIVGATMTGTAGTWMANVYDFLVDDWDGTPLDLVSDIVAIFGNPFGTDLRDVLGAVNQMATGLTGLASSGTNPHTGYGIIKIDGTNTSYDLATTYLDTVGAANAPTVGTDFQDHTAGGSGSLTITANGADHKWVHPEYIAVAQDQVIDVSAWTKTSGYTGTGTPIRIGVVTYLNGVEVATQTLAQGGAAASWTKLSGSYTIPAGVDKVRFCLLVTPTATAGKINFDDLSLTKTGLLQKSFVAGLEASLTGFAGDIATGASNLADLINDLWTNPVSVINNFLASMVPPLDASKIISGVFGPSVIPGLDAAKIVSGQFLTSLIPNLNAAIINAGTFLTSLIPSLDASKIISGQFLTSLIPNLNASIITAGTFLSSLIPNLNASIINAGTFLSSLIPALDASKITTGLLNILRIPDFDAGKIVSGIVSRFRIGIPDFENFTAGSDFEGTTQPWFLGAGVTIATDQAHSGTHSMKLTNSQSYTGLGDATTNLTYEVKPGEQIYMECWARKSTTYVDNDPANNYPRIRLIRVGGPSGGTTIGNIMLRASDFTASDTWEKKSITITIPNDGTVGVIFGIHSLLTTSAGNVWIDDIVVRRVKDPWTIAGLDVSQIISGVFGSIRIPSLDASKIISGQFLTSLIPNLNASIITAGTFLSSLIPNLNASIINAGTFLSSLIPNLDATKITTGQFLTSLIPNLNASIITAGTFLSSLIPNLNASIINAGTFLSSLIPGLDASKIITGTFAQSFVTNLVSDLGSRVTTAIHNLFGSSRANLVVDPKMENTTIWNFSGMMNTGGAWTTADAHSGTHSVSLTGPNQWVYMIGSGYAAGVTLDVKPADKYYFEFWVKGKSTNTGGGTVSLAPRVLDSTGVAGTVDNSAMLSGATTSGIANPAGGFAWTKKSGYFQIPAAYDKLQPYISTSGSLPAGDVIYVDDLVIREVTEPQNIIAQLFSGGTSILSTIAAAVVPALDASKIATGQFLTSLIPNLNASIITAGTFLSSLIPNLNASIINAGTFLSSLIPGLDASKITTGTFLSSLIPNLNASIITAGTFLSSLIPNLNASIINAGTFLTSLIPALDASKITSGTFAQSFVTGLTTLSNMFTGRYRAGSNLIQDPQFDQASLWNLTTSGSNGGSFSTAQKRSGTQSLMFTIPVGLASTFMYITQNATTGGLDAVKCKAGDKFYVEFWYFAPTANASSTTQVAVGAYANDSTGVNADIFPTITSAVIVKNAWTKVSGYYTVPTGYDRLAIYVRGNIGGTGTAGDLIYVDDVMMREVTETQNVVAALFGSVGASLNTLVTSIIPNLNASIINAGTFLTSLIPGLDASKITSGTFLSSLIPNLNASIITAGTFLSSLIPNLNASIINAGTFVASLIPSLDASKITTGVINALRIPDITAAMSSGITNANNALQSLYETLYNGVKGVPFIGAGLANILAGFQDLMTKLFANIVPQTAITTAAVPNLDASKLTSGTIIKTVIPDITRDMSSDVQLISDSINEAINGGTQSGTDPSSLADSLKNIPAENVLYPPDPVSTITQVSAGAGSWSTTEWAGGGAGLNPYQKTSWSETIGATADYIVIPITWRNNIYGLSDLSRSVYVGTQGGGPNIPAFSLGAVKISSGVFVEFFALRVNSDQGIRGTAQTIEATVFCRQTAGAGIMNGIAGTSMSYKGVYRGDLLATTTGTSTTSLTQTLTSVTGRMIVQMFSMQGFGGVTFSAYNKTQRYLTAGPGFPVVIGDAAGGASVTFTATASSAINYFGAAIQLIPSPINALGSGFLQVRTSTATSSLLASGNNPLAASWFDTSIGITSDLSYNSTTNTLTVTRAGWYMVECNLLGNGANEAGGRSFRAILYQNGSVASSQAQGAVVLSGSGFTGLSHTFIVYCSAGDTLALGTNASATAASARITGEASGTQCYMKVALMNRSLA